ncbi:hydrogenase [Burkholderia vietnamiensis]|uniref:hydrogenase n=1 Tax=Burkholderia vietnamiensis TaxID=60552 RepID=UPI0015939E8C|nr:hydrogenase [Burkholderia vietnamiensis]WHU96338.1 hydrogenase [Burkholderia vietnamiensis]
MSETSGSVPGATQADAPNVPNVPNAAAAGQDCPAVVQRLIEQAHATFVDEHTLDGWLADGGECVVLLMGDPVRFPESLDVAAVLPELAHVAAVRFGRALRLAVATRAGENAIARRFGSLRWPALLWLRDGQYVTVLSGMMDWDDYVKCVADALASPTTRAPSIGIPVNVAGGSSGCH